MPIPIIWIAALGAVALLEEACKSKSENATGTTPPPDAGVTPTETNTNQPARSLYVPPQQLFVPAATLEGIHYHPLFRASATTPFRESYPLGLNCGILQNQCLTALGTKDNSFSTANLNNDDPLSLTVTTDFSPDIDGQAQFVSDRVVVGGVSYALFSDFSSQQSPAGIAIRDANGNSLHTYSFQSTTDSPLSCPHSLLSFGNEIWVSFSNCVGSDNFRDGKIFSLTRRDNGALDATTDANLTTTQYNPQPMAGWNTADKAYILSVNTGKTAYNLSTGNTEILSESGVDVIDPDLKKIIANIPLGRAAANTITISGDNKAAFLGSQNLPNIYVLDLEWLGKRLKEINLDSPSPVRLTDVALADARNPVAISSAASAFIPALRYDDKTHTLFVSSFNDGRLFQLKADYEEASGGGISLKPAFATILGQYLCANEGTDYCGDIALTEGGIIAMTGHPASVTFLPNARVGR